MTSKQTTTADTSMSNLLITAKYHDLLIHSKDDTFKVHRAIVCSASDVIATAVDRWQQKDAKIAEFDMRAEDPLVVKAFIEFLYLGSYSLQGLDESRESTLDEPADIIFKRGNCLRGDHHPVPRTSGMYGLERMAADRLRMGEAYLSSFEPRTPLVTDNTRDAAADYPFHAKMYILGEMYNVESLKRVTAERFRCVGSDPDWQIRCVDQFDGFPEAVKLLWEGTPDSDQKMREVVGQVGFRCLGDVRQDMDLKELLPEEGSFAAWVLAAAHKQMTLKEAAVRPRFGNGEYY